MASMSTASIFISNSEPQMTKPPVGPHLVTMKSAAKGHGGVPAQLLALLWDVLDLPRIRTARIELPCPEINLEDPPADVLSLFDLLLRAVRWSIQSQLSRDLDVPGTRIGPYEILERIGAGSMGEVYRAIDSRLNRIVAIKRLKACQTSRFQQEARALAALNHPNICTLYDVGPDYLVMEYVEGDPLKGPLPLEDALRVAVHVADAIEAAHAAGILHRDLKPDNVLVTSKGVVKLLDFGLAKIRANARTDVTQTFEGTVIGSAAYMSPEQAQGRELDERSEVFSFGALLYETISGYRAFGRTSVLDTLNAVVREEPARLEISLDIARVLTRCLHKHPADRFQSMAEVKRALEECTVPAPVTTILDHPSASRRCKHQQGKRLSSGRF
jgi:serine/threonine protein kinase